MLICFGSCGCGEGNGGDRSLEYKNVSSLEIGTVELVKRKEKSERF